MDSSSELALHVRRNYMFDKTYVNIVGMRSKVRKEDKQGQQPPLGLTCLRVDPQGQPPPQGLMCPCLEVGPQEQLLLQVLTCLTVGPQVQLPS